MNFEAPDIEPALSQINEELGQISDLTQDEIEWAYERGADTIEDVMQLVSEHKQLKPNSQVG